MANLSRIAFAPLALPALALAACAPVDPPGFGDPAALACSTRPSLSVAVETFEVAAPDGRIVPFEVIRPAGPGRYPLLAFSHGALAAPDRYYAMLKPLAASGYIVIAPMHIESEEWNHPEPPPRDDVWRTRNEDLAMAIAVPEAIDSALTDAGVFVDTTRKATIGHSYGGLIAQLPAGARAIEPDGSQVDRRDPEIDAVVAWSPPSALPGMMAEEGWNSIAVPSLTITGTADALPGFIPDWEMHMQSYTNAPIGGRWLWVGDDIDHYFGGMFGREKPADANSQTLFGRALAVNLHFLDTALDREDACYLGPPVAGERIEKD